jgi:hypothetical protein
MGSGELQGFNAGNAATAQKAQRRKGAKAQRRKGAKAQRRKGAKAQRRKGAKAQRRKGAKAQQYVSGGGSLYDTMTAPAGTHRC